MDTRGAAVPAEYLAKARRADEESAHGASNNNSGAGEEHEGWGVGNYVRDPAHLPGPIEKKLRAHPPPIGLCFGAYSEASQGVHDLARLVAEKLAEDRGDELGCAKERVLGVFTQRIRCEWEMAAIRARARSREVRRPRVGCSRPAASKPTGCSQEAAHPRSSGGNRAKPT